MKFNSESDILYPCVFAFFNQLRWSLKKTQFDIGSYKKYLRVLVDSKPNGKQKYNGHCLKRGGCISSAIAALLSQGSDRDHHTLHGSDPMKQCV